MRRSLPSSSLINLKFGVIGLGDSSYEQYNHFYMQKIEFLIKIIIDTILWQKNYTKGC